MKAIPKISVIDQVVQTIKTAIIEKEFDIGQKMPSEMELCKSLGVSRSTVRESFRVLQTMGFIELRAGRGAFVSSLEPYDFGTIRNWFQTSAPVLKDFFEVRVAVEGLACREAAQRACNNDFLELEEILVVFEQAVYGKKVEVIAQYDELFHGTIVKMAKNPLLTKIHGLIEMEFKKFRSLSFAVDSNAKNALEPHTKILESLKERDGEKAEIEMGRHIDLAIKDMEKMIK